MLYLRDEEGDLHLTTQFLEDNDLLVFADLLAEGENVNGYSLIAFGDHTEGDEKSVTMEDGNKKTNRIVEFTRTEK